MSTITKNYRQQPYGDHYTIVFRPQPNGTFKIYCPEHPDNPHSTDVTKCHLYSSGEICVAAGKEPRTLDRAKAIAMFWIDGYSRYIRTGVFPNGNAKVNV